MSHPSSSIFFTHSVGDSPESDLKFVEKAESDLNPVAMLTPVMSYFFSFSRRPASFRRTYFNLI